MDTDDVAVGGDLGETGPHAVADRVAPPATAPSRAASAAGTTTTTPSDTECGDAPRPVDDSLVAEHFVLFRTTEPAAPIQPPTTIVQTFGGRLHGSRVVPCSER